MNALQRIFDRLVGISASEILLHHRAQQIFGAPGIDLDRLHKPACWRRRRYPRNGKRT